MTAKRSYAEASLQKMSVSEEEVAKASQGPITTMATRLKEGDSVVKDKAFWELRRAWHDPKAIDLSLMPDLVAILQDKNENIFNRAHAVHLLGIIGPPANGAMPAIIACLNEQIKDGNRYRLMTDAMNALVLIAPEDPVVLDILNTESLKTGFERTNSAVVALAKLGKPAVPHLLKLLDSRQLLTVHATCGAGNGLGAVQSEPHKN